SPAQVGDFADGRGEGVVDDDQVVVGVQRQLVGVERAFSLPWRSDEFLGKGAVGQGARGGKGGRADGETVEESATRERPGIRLHGSTFHKARPPYNSAGTGIFHGILAEMSTGIATSNARAASPRSAM